MSGHSTTAIVGVSTDPVHVSAENDGFVVTLGHTSLVFSPDADGAAAADQLATALGVVSDAINARLSNEGGE